MEVGTSEDKTHRPKFIQLLAECAVRHLKGFVLYNKFLSQLGGNLLCVPMCHWVFHVCSSDVAA